MFRLAHISDVHLAPLPRVAWRELLSKRATGYANWRLKRARSHRPQILAGLIEDLRTRTPDHISVTGDLINIGVDAEIANAASFLEALGDPRDVTVICGNHDAYVKGSLERALAAWQAYVAGDDGARVRGSSDYPILRRRGDISIIGCNAACPTAPFFATGRFDRPQADRLAKILEMEGDAGRCRIILIHNPPVPRSTAFHKRLIGQDLFREAVERGGAELVLHGHTHLATITRISGRDGAVPVVGVPAAGQAPGGKRPAARYNLFSIERKPAPANGWSIIRQEFGYPGKVPEISEIGQMVDLASM